MLACMQHASTREEGGVEIYGRDLWMMVSNYFLVFLAVLALTTASANLRLRHAADCATVMTHMWLRMKEARFNSFGAVRSDAFVMSLPFASNTSSMANCAPFGPPKGHNALFEYTCST